MRRLSGIGKDLSPNDDTVLALDRVSKKYCRSVRRSILYGIGDTGRNLAGLTAHPGTLRAGEFFAVCDVSFRAGKGESLGIIGPNSSGKSTLLKLINGIFWPDRGEIVIRGRVGSLIEVIGGFHPALTGRENVYVNAAILGMSREETDRKLGDIADFAGVRRQLDVLSKYYSTGMIMRLGLAVAVHCEPDILLFDEVLSVGDARFIDRFTAHIRKLVRQGVTLIMVSHDIRLIKSTCARALLMDQGRLVMDGETNAVIDYYREKFSRAPDSGL